MPEAFSALHFFGTAVLAVVLATSVYLVFRWKRILPGQISASLPAGPTIIAVTLLALLLPAGWRLALLPWRAMPAPEFADEYVH